jgi:hypothetical protein
MLITIQELRRWFEEDSATLVNRLQEETGRYGSDEAKVWQRSLQTLTSVFRALMQLPQAREAVVPQRRGRRLACQAVATSEGWSSEEIPAKFSRH